VDKLMIAAGEAGRYGHRDATSLLLAYRHGLRVSELVSLRWDQVDLKHGLLHVGRLKNGTPSTHPLRGPELRALRKLQQEQTQDGGYAFTSERGGPMTTDNARKMMQRPGRGHGIHSRCIPICSAMQRSTSSPTIAMTRVPFSTQRVCATLRAEPRWTLSGFQ